MFENLFDVQYNLNYNDECVGVYSRTNKLEDIPCTVTPKTDHGMLVLADKMNIYNFEDSPFAYKAVRETYDGKYVYIIPEWALRNSIEVADRVGGLWVNINNDEHLEVSYV